ncbi:ABC transporter permease [Bifidobacterium aquikefiricola]|uniref:ABC transporter permease n=1 Tax=Bifidobacterium aquikefiricola TaxID=3059038 RepID=A0AB39U9D8_9BIFI
MGRHQHAENSGLISFIICAIAAAIMVKIYVEVAPPIWQVTRRMFTVAAGIVTFCGVSSFIVGYARNSNSLNLRRGWWMPVRRSIEIVALSVVYAATIFLAVFAIFGIITDMMGVRIFLGYLPWVSAAFAGIVGYITFVQADLMDAKTIASLLPLFVVSGVTTAGLTTDDPNWWHNNFSQLGDRTTFAATMFNATLILAGICIIIISYFAVSELLTTHRMRADWSRAHLPAPQVGDSNDHVDSIQRFRLRAGILLTLLVLLGVAFMGIGTFRYSPHPILHNVFSRGLPGIMCVLLIGLPWIAPQLSKAIYIVSDLGIVTCAIAGGFWLEGDNTLTNVEALAGLIFLGWFIVFSRHIAAIEADRVQAQIIYLQSIDTSAIQPARAPESRLASDK